MTRDEIIDSHLHEAQAVRAMGFGLVPVAVAMFLIMENSSISRFNTGAWVLFVPCALPVVGARYGWANGIVWTLGAVIPGLTALIFTGEAMSVFWSALLGLLGVLVFHLVLRNAPAPRLGKAALDKLNAELRSAGHEIESMR